MTPEAANALLGALIAVSVVLLVLVVLAVVAVVAVARFLSRFRRFDGHREGGEVALQGRFDDWRDERTEGEPS